jgi:hypothetical protein
MPLTATKLQTAKMLGISDDTVDNLLHQRRLSRTPGNRYVHITLQSIADYTSLPLEQVVRELQELSRPPVGAPTASLEGAAATLNAETEKRNAA